MSRRTWSFRGRTYTLDDIALVAFLFIVAVGLILAVTLMVEGGVL